MSQAFKVDLFSCSIISGLPDFKDSTIQLYTYNIHGYFMIFIFTKVTSNPYYNVHINGESIRRFLCNVL
jgi:hypothetical protein